jgi:hypothetical protein
MFDFVLEYRTGKTNPADGPSRRPNYKQNTDESMILTLYSKLRAMERINEPLLVAAAGCGALDKPLIIATLGRHFFGYFAKS